MQTLESPPIPVGEDPGPSHETPAPTGADLVAAMQASPYKEIDLEPLRDRLPVRDPSLIGDGGALGGAEGGNITLQAQASGG